MTFAACETVDDPVVVAAEEVGAGAALDGVVAALLVGGASSVAELGATSAADGGAGAADGGTGATDAVGEALVVAAVDGAEGA
jgi:hypothetical protein